MLLFASSPPVLATQELALEPDVNGVDECGVAVPMATILQKFEEGIRNKLFTPASACIDISTEFPKGNDDSTSEDDVLELHALVWTEDQVIGLPCTAIGAHVKVKIKFIPGETEENPDAGALASQYACQDQPPPSRLPSFFVSRVYLFTATHTVHCAGDDCPTAFEYWDQDAEDVRCELQAEFQQAAEQVTPESVEYDLAIDPGLVATNPTDIMHPAGVVNQKYRTTITETGGNPHLLVWRIPDVQAPLSDAWIVDQARSKLLASSDLAAQYGVFLMCDRGQSCAHDQDHDGWCDADDVCPDRFNRTNDSPVDSDGDGIPDACDNCPNYGNPDQLDVDYDLIGDPCDDDIDGDGIPNDSDVDDYNPELRLDVDGDGVPDKRHWGTSEQWHAHRYECTASCAHVRNVKTQLHPDGPGWIQQWTGYFDRCMRLCNLDPDNCADGQIPVGQTRPHWDFPACEATYNALVSGSAPSAANLQSCEDHFANPEQVDQDGNGVGDRCETRVLGLTFTPDEAVYRTEDGILICGVETYQVSFHGNAAALDTPELRNDTSVESCSCNAYGPDGDWADNCTDYGGTCDQYGRQGKWNPIRDQVFGWAQDPAYPLAEGLDASLGAFLQWPLHAMGRDRQFTFERSASGGNHEFHWDWLHTKHLPYPFDPATAWGAVADEPLDTSVATIRPVKVRVAHSDAVVSDNHWFQHGNSTLSEGVRYLYRPGPCNPIPFAPVAWNQFLWLDPGPLRVRVPGVLRERLPPVAGLVEGSDSSLALVRFDRSMAEPSSLQQLVVRGGSDVPLDLTGLRTTSGLLDYSLVEAGQAERPAVFAYGTPASGSSPVLWVGLLSGETSEWMTASQAFGASAGEQMPALVDGAPVFDQAGQRLLVLGHEWSGGGVVAGPELVHNVLWSLDLETGEWARWGQIEVLGDAEGASVTFDPVKQRLLVFGGREGTTSLGRLVEVQLYPLGSRVLRDCVASEACPGSRSLHGAAYDAVGHTLYVYGGQRDGQALSDGGRIDLLTGTWSPLPADDSGGPGPRTRPVLTYDPKDNALWVAGGAPGETYPEPWELNLDSQSWLRRPSLTLETQNRTVAPGEPLKLLSSVEESVSFPGQVRLIQTQSSEPGLALRLTDEQGRVLAEDTAPATTHQALLLGQPGQRYQTRVSTSASYSGAPAVTVDVTDQEATLEPAGVITGLPETTSVVASRGVAYVGHGTKVTAVDLVDPEHPAVLGQVDTGGLVQQLALCGPDRLCVAQTWGAQSLVVVDAQDPQALRVAGGIFLPGLCRGLAVRDGAAYVACGAAGVHVVALGAPSGPVLADTLWVGGPVSSVDVSGRILVAGLFGRRVKAYAIGGSSGPEFLGSLHTDKHPVRVRLFGSWVHVSEARGLGWALCVTGVRCGPGPEVEVLSVDEQGPALDLVGAYDGAFHKAPYATAWRDLVLVPTLTGARVLRAEVSP